MSVEALIVNTAERGPGQMLGLDDAGWRPAAPRTVLGALGLAGIGRTDSGMTLAVVTGVALVAALWWVFVTPPGRRT